MAENAKNENRFLDTVKKVLSYIFIDGLGGMATGLFCTLIIGTIICQIGALFGIGNYFGYFINLIGNFAKILMGAGIGVGVSLKLKKAPLVTVSAGAAGMVGAYSAQIIKKTVLSGSITTLSSVGEPLGAFAAAFVAIEVGSLIAGKTKLDIILTPLVAILSGSIAGLLIGTPISEFMKFLGEVIEVATIQQPIIMGILVAVIMGVSLTLPISSAAIGVSLHLSGLAAGAAVVGCCCHMIGFAVMSYKENKVGGLIAQGLGTSMLQMPNLVKHPLCWLPPIIASAAIGPFSTTLAKIVSSPVGSGMGTAGLVGPIETYFAMTAAGTSPVVTLILILTFCFLLPAAVTLGVSVLFRKLGWIKDGELKLAL